MSVVEYISQEIVWMETVLWTQSGCDDPVDGRRCPLRFE
jgi:hypothetical protein